MVTSTAFKAGSSTTLDIQHVQQMQFHATPRRDEEAKTGVVATEEESKGLWDPMFMIPIGFTAAIPALHNEWFIINEETQVHILFFVLDGRSFLCSLY